MQYRPRSCGHIPIAIERMADAADRRSSPTIAGQTPRFVHRAGANALDPPPYPYKWMHHPCEIDSVEARRFFPIRLAGSRMAPGTRGQYRRRCGSIVAGAGAGMALDRVRGSCQAHSSASTGVAPCRRHLNPTTLDLRSSTSGRRRCRRAETQALLRHWPAPQGADGRCVRQRLAVVGAPASPGRRRRSGARYLGSAHSAGSASRAVAQASSRARLRTAPLSALVASSA